MGLDDIVNKAKDALGGEEAIEAKIEQAREFIKDKTPDSVDAYVDKAADAAHNAVDTDGEAPGAANLDPAAASPLSPDADNVPAPGTDGTTQL